MVKDYLEKHKEPKDITNDLNDLKRQRNENSNLIDFCQKKLKEGNFNGIITREGHEQKLKELIKKNEQMEKQLREFNDNSSHSKKLNNEKLKDKREVILEKRNTELKQKLKNENLKEEEQISKEKAKELGRNLPNHEHEKESSSEVKEKEKVSDDNNKDKEMFRDNNAKREFDRTLIKNHLVDIFCRSIKDNLENVDNPEEYIKKNPKLNYDLKKNLEKNLDIPDKVLSRVLRYSSKCLDEDTTKALDNAINLYNRVLERPHGYIYLLKNFKNEKVYVGKTERDKEKRYHNDPILDRWIRHKKRAEKLKNKREANPEKKFYGTHLKNSIIKYGQNAFNLKQIDVAYSPKELNVKEKYWIGEYDSMNHEKGYNMSSGGDGGRQRLDVLKKISDTMKKKYQDPKYLKERKEAYKKQSDTMKKKHQDPEYRKNYIKARETPEFKKKQKEIIEKLNKALKKKYQDPKFQKKRKKLISEGMKKKYQDPKYLEERKEVYKKQSDIMKKKHQDPEFKMKLEKTRKTPEYKEKRKKANKKHSDIMKKKHQDPEYRKNYMKARENPEYKKRLSRALRKEIGDIKIFLIDIKSGMLKKELIQKYNMSSKTINRRIKEILGRYGPQNFSEAKKFLEDKDIDEIL